MDIKILPLASEDAAARFGAALGPLLQCGDIICLAGPLGAGKTTLARGLITALFGPGDIPSPTFTLVETYRGDSLSLWHFDLYRLEQASEVWELGLEDSLNDGVTLIEWPDRIAGLLPPDALHLNIDIDKPGQRRLLRIEGGQGWRERLTPAGIV